MNSNKKMERDFESELKSILINLYSESLKQFLISQNKDEAELIISVKDAFNETLQEDKSNEQ